MEDKKIVLDKNMLYEKGFNDLQIFQIQKGLREKIDVSLYMDIRFDFLQMEEIRKGLEDGLDVLKYSNEKYDLIDTALDYKKSELEDAQKEIEQLEEMIKKAEKAKIIVRGRINRGTSVTINGSEITIKSPAIGVRFVNADGTRVRAVTL